jgi:hypothetical protein
VTARIQGVRVPLDAPLAEVCACMAHPDNFLYVVLDGDAVRRP